MAVWRHVDELLQGLDSWILGNWIPVPSEQAKEFADAIDCWITVRKVCCRLNKGPRVFNLIS